MPRVMPHATLTHGHPSSIRPGCHRDNVLRTAPFADRLNSGEVAG